MNGKEMLYLSAVTGQVILAKTLKELQAKSGGGRIHKLYSSLKGGGTTHIGYVIGNNWLTAYTPYESVQ